LGRINLITGTASGKIGQFQYQTHGMKCVVRTKQPGGLTNDQAELVNKPILLNLSSAYHRWAKYLLSHYPSDWSKPQALWNYYTKCNQAIFDGAADYEAGYAVVKHGASKQYQATYTLRSWEQTAFFQFDENPVELDTYAVVCLVHGLTSGPPEEWDTVMLSVTPAAQPVPYWAEKDGSVNIGYFLLEHSGKLYAGVTLCSVRGERPPEYFSPSPEEITANMLVYEEQGVKDIPLQIRLSFNTAFMPAWAVGKSVRYTAHTDLVGHPAGTSWADTYNPSAVFNLPDYVCVSPLDPLLSWEILDGATVKSDLITLNVSEIITPPDFFARSGAVIYQAKAGTSGYEALIWFQTETIREEYYSLNFYIKFTAQGSFTSLLPENPMFFKVGDSPDLWHGIPYVTVTPPCGTVQLVVGDHPDDSRYYFGPPFTVGYEEG
jgi:hypothetical protein